MAQVPENFAAPADVACLIPKNSTDFASGDVVVVASNNNPMSRVVLGTSPGRMMPIGAAFHAQWLAGIVDTPWSSALSSAAVYAAPGADQAMSVNRSGFYYLAITNTAGEAGDYVAYSSGASGSQLFAIDNQRPGNAIGTLVKTFSGASANDRQLVQLRTIPLGGLNLYFWLENRVLSGCMVSPCGPTDGANSANIGVGVAGTDASHDDRNVVLIQNKAASLAFDATLAVGDCSVTGTSTLRFRWVVARTGGFGVRTATGRYTAASFTGASVSAPMLIPKAWTVGEIPIALLINFSTPQSYTAGLIKNIRGANYIPKVGSWGI